MLIFITISSALNIKIDLKIFEFYHGINIFLWSRDVFSKSLTSAKTWLTFCH